MRQLVGDITGGLVAALIALPYGLAMAHLMGLPPSFGLLTSIVTAPLTALLGRNPVLIGGTSTVTVPFIAAAVAKYGPAGAAKITIVAGIFMMIFSSLRWGSYITKVPATVVSGFSCGIGVMMIISQLKTLFGIKATISGSMLEQLVGAISNIGLLSPAITAIGLTTVAAAAICTTYFPRLPSPMISMLVACGAAALFGWHDREVGALSVGVPDFVRFTWSADDVLKVIPSALGLAIVTSVNLLITSRVVEHFRGRHKHLRPSDADRELSAYGIANLAAGLVGAPFSVGIPARSLANVRCGGSTRFSNIIHAGFLLLFMTVASGLVAHIPVSALAGVTAWMGFCLLEWSTWFRLNKMRWWESLAFVLTVFSVLFVNAAISVTLGCSVYVVRWLYHKWLDSQRAGEAVAKVEAPKSQAANI